jgi:hypothetical protein
MQWLMAIIPATQEFIKRMKFKASLGKKVSKTPSQPTSCKWWYLSLISATQEAEIRGLKSKLAPGKNVRS